MKRQLQYFEDLFAKKTTSEAARTQHPFSTASSTDQHSRSSSARLSPVDRNPSVPAKEKDDQEAQEDSEISFVLERTTPATGSSMVGLFSLAVVVCVCCVHSLYQNKDEAGNEGQEQHSNPGFNMQVAAKDAVQKTAQEAWFAAILTSLLGHALKIICVLAFACVVALFPKDQIVQWAARKPFLRRIFNFKDVKLGAQTKFVKIDKLI